MRLNRRALLVWSAYGGAAWAGLGGKAARAAVFRDPLHYPALKYDGLDRRPLQGVVAAGSRFVAVGLRGLVIYSADNGVTWTQARCPVQSDLLAVDFPSPMLGWIVGHDGVILHSRDGGHSWEKQLDGVESAKTFVNYVERPGVAADVSASLRLLQENVRVPASLPYLSVRFADEKRGLAVGSFGMAARTEDGGQTWIPALEEFQGLRGLNLNAIGSNDLIAAEQGVVYRPSDSGGGRNSFTGVATPAKGSYYGIANNSSVSVAFGLRGEIARSTDVGQTWVMAKSRSNWSIFAGCALPNDKGFILVNSIGEVLHSDTDGQIFNRLDAPSAQLKIGEPTGAIALLGGREILISGLGGIQKVSLSLS
ncbi:YCF48-related protein [Acidocella sp.]|uniref:WD40/YVTN/BNR-like repeat-containing protein n=1 Tax=Acidocella sp. TaxID=50710 RepID=UPI00262E8A0A|nr:YCF48-related protein [Acidocella sp.]